ncbi:hypothetical protein CLV92_12513 [Kineococcus xinjiangensis]|uniref:DUF4192 family protein n=1 Tax=Kineococcus xinjiangensis TaxID=512762 RepID=A0A2S6IC37_9ACTN|nr:hypothetical protein [Kineococcus xinjiangensis]PPK90217.1 hypothetical protein CLV92_12513 [Kineococcus xinjiangensis]
MDVLTASATPVDDIERSQAAWHRWLFDGDDAVTMQELRAAAYHRASRDALLVMAQRGSWAESWRWSGQSLWTADTRTAVAASHRQPDLDLAGRIIDGFARIADDAAMPTVERANAHAAIAFLSWVCDDPAMAEAVALDALALNPAQRLAIILTDTLAHGLVPLWKGKRRG